MERYPAAQVVASAPAFKMMKAYFGARRSFADRRRAIAKEGFELDLGGHALAFVGAANVHWPEVLFSYESTTKTLFSADGFGKFGALDVEDPEGLGVRGQALLLRHRGQVRPQRADRAQEGRGPGHRAHLPLHGPVLDQNLDYYLSLYNTWSSYEPEDKGVTVAYASVYGNTRQAALELAGALEARGQKVSVFDLARDDMAEAVEDAFRYDRLVLASVTYNGGVFPCMGTFIRTLAEHAYQNRTVALVESGTWAPTAAKVMRAQLEEMKDVNVAEQVGATVRGALDDASRTQIAALADELCA